MQQVSLVIVLQLSLALRVGQCKVMRVRVSALVRNTGSDSPLSFLWRDDWGRQRQENHVFIRSCSRPRINLIHHQIISPWRHVRVLFEMQYALKIRTLLPLWLTKCSLLFTQNIRWILRKWNPVCTKFIAAEIMPRLGNCNLDRRSLTRPANYGRYDFRRAVK